MAGDDPNSTREERIIVSPNPYEKQLHSDYLLMFIFFAYTDAPSSQVQNKYIVRVGYKFYFVQRNHDELVGVENVQ